MNDHDTDVDLKGFNATASGKYSPPNSVQCSQEPAQEMGIPLQDFPLKTCSPKEHNTASLESQGVQETKALHHCRQEKTRPQEATEEVENKPITEKLCFLDHSWKKTECPSRTENQEDQLRRESQEDQSTDREEDRSTVSNQENLSNTHKADPLIAPGQPATSPTTNQTNPEDMKAKVQTERGNKCGQPTNQSENSMTKKCGPITVTIKSLTDSLKVIPCGSAKNKDVEVEMTIHPNTLENGSDNNSIAKAQLKLAVTGTENLKQCIIGKTKTCTVSATTKVAEKGTGEVLAMHKNQEFKLPAQGIASFQCELITNQELGQSNTKKVDIVATITIQVQEWKAKVELLEDGYWCITSL